MIFFEMINFHKSKYEILKLQIQELSSFNIEKIEEDLLFEFGKNRKLSYIFNYLILGFYLDMILKIWNFKI